MIALCAAHLENSTLYSSFNLFTHRYTADQQVPHPPTPWDFERILNEYYTNRIDLKCKCFMSNYMNRYSFLAWPLYEMGGIFKVLPAHPRHNFYILLPPPHRHTPTRARIIYFNYIAWTPVFDQSLNNIVLRSTGLVLGQLY